MLGGAGLVRKMVEKGKKKYFECKGTVWENAEGYKCKHVKHRNHIKFAKLFFILFLF